MGGLRELVRRWRIAHYEHQRHHLEEASFRAHTMLGAYGLDPSGDTARHA